MAFPILALPFRDLGLGWALTRDLDIGLSLYSCFIEGDYSERIGGVLENFVSMESHKEIEAKD